MNAIASVAGAFFWGGGLVFSSAREHSMQGLPARTLNASRFASPRIPLKNEWKG